MIVLLAHFIQYSETSNNRFEYLYNRVSKNKNVTFISSSFDHKNKIQRKYNPNLNIKLAYEPGYPKNTSIKRLFSHFIFGFSVLLKLIKIKPEKIYFSFPSISVLLFVNLYKRIFNKDVVLIIDIQDLWPESFQMINQKLLIRILSRLQEYIIAFSAKKIDKIIACSKSFGIHFTSKYKIRKSFIVVYIGTETKRYEIAKFSGQARIVYVGNLSKSYDLFKTIDFIDFAKNEIPNIELDIIGYGDDHAALKEYAEFKSVRVNFLGYKDIEYIRKNLKNYQFAINPIIPNSVSSILNKVADYSASGLPVINTQKNEEYQNLLKTFNAGESFNILDKQSILDFIFKLINDESIWNLYSNGSYKLANKKFNRVQAYDELEKEFFQ